MNRWRSLSESHLVFFLRRTHCASSRFFFHCCIVVVCGSIPVVHIFLGNGVVERERREHADTSRRGLNWVCM